MKRIILAILLAVTIAVGIGSIASIYGPGYVVFSFAEYTVETSFIFMLGFIALGFFVFYYVLRIIAKLVYIPNFLSRQHSKRQSERSKNALVKGLIEMSEGRFESAEKVLLKQVDNSDTSLLNYLMAARAAQQLGEYDRRDEYLRLAHETTPSADIAISLTQAELQLSHQQYEQAMATLNHLVSVSPKHGYVKKLLARSYRQLEDWDSLSKVLTDVKKMKVMTEEQYKQQELEAYTGMLKNSIKQQDEVKTEAIWKKLPRYLKSEPELLEYYALYCHKQKKDDAAEVIIRKYLSEYWTDTLALLYSELNVSEPKKQLQTAETWLHNHPRNAVLLLVLGKLCMKCQLWGKARGYLESSIGVKPLAEAHLKLAKLLEDKMDEPEEAQKIYQQGLLAAVDCQTDNDVLRLASTGENNGRPLLKVIQ